MILKCWHRNRRACSLCAALLCTAAIWTQTSLVHRTDRERTKAQESFDSGGFSRLIAEPAEKPPELEEATQKGHTEPKHQPKESEKPAEPEAIPEDLPFDEYFHIV